MPFFKDLERFAGKVEHGAKPILGKVGEVSKAGYKELKPVIKTAGKLAEREANVLIKGQETLLGGASGILGALSNPLVIVGGIILVIVVAPAVLGRR